MKTEQFNQVLSELPRKHAVNMQGVEDIPLNSGGVEVAYFLTPKSQPMAGGYSMYKEKEEIATAYQLKVVAGRIWDEDGKDVDLTNDQEEELKAYLGEICVCDEITYS